HMTARLSDSHISHLSPVSLTLLSSFQRYLDHRDLHSFPTRRSSDLGYYRIRQADRYEASFAGGEANVAVSLANYGEKVKFVTKLDRKSTRLNSSHVSISYAVFCLKKKKKMLQ